jgi:hypothetical protein
VLKNVAPISIEGKVEQVRIQPELLQRGDFIWERKSPEADRNYEERKVSLDEYEALVELYQARNAVNFADSAGAAEHSAEALARAQNALQTAEDYYRSRDLKRTVVAAREATQSAEDARIVATTRRIRAGYGSPLQ